MVVSKAGTERSEQMLSKRRLWISRAPWGAMGGTGESDTHNPSPVGPGHLRLAAPIQPWLQQSSLPANSSCGLTSLRDPQDPHSRTRHIPGHAYRFRVLPVFALAGQSKPDKVWVCGQVAPILTSFSARQVHLAFASGGWQRWHSHKAQGCSPPRATGSMCSILAHQFPLPSNMPGEVSDLF